MLLMKQECIKSMSYSSYWWDFAFSFSEHVFCCFALILSVCCCISAIHILLKTFDSLQLHLMYSHGNKYWFNLKKRKSHLVPKYVCMSVQIPHANNILPNIIEVTSMLPSAHMIVANRPGVARFEPKSIK